MIYLLHNKQLQQERNSCQRCSIKKGVPKNFAKITDKSLPQSCNFIIKETLALFYRTPPGNCLWKVWNMAVTLMETFGGSTERSCFKKVKLFKGSHQPCRNKTLCLLEIRSLQRSVQDLKTKQTKRKLYSYYCSLQISEELRGFTKPSVKTEYFNNIKILENPKYFWNTYKQSLPNEHTDKRILPRDPKLHLIP